MKKESANMQDQSGKALRDHTWEDVHAAGVDYAPKFISLKNEFTGKTEPIDGLIRTSHGYYRLAEDIRNGNRILLHSFERDQLTGVQKDDRVMLAEDATDVYGVNARQAKRGALFRYLMERDNWVLTRIFQQNLNLHCQEMMISSETPGVPDRKKVKLANDMVAFGIVETDDGKWNIRFYNNLRRNWDDAAGFTMTASEMGNSKINKLLNPVRYFKDKEGNIETFERLEDAIFTVRRYWKSESRRFFRGQELLDEKFISPMEKAHYSALSWALRVKDQRIFRDWSRALTVAVVVGVGSTFATGTPIAGALAVLPIFGWSFFAKSLETATASFQKWLLKNSDKKKLEARLMSEEVEFIKEYQLDTEDNKKRYRKKLNEESYKYLRLLDHEEADMIHDDAEPVPPTNDMRDFERLTSAAYRYFGTQFDSSNDNEENSVLVATYPNGLISLTHVEKQTRAARHYVTYNKNFDVFGEKEDKKHLDPNITELPSEGDVHKISHRKGKDFRYTPLSCHEFIADLSYKLDENAKNIKAFGMPLTTLFNCTAIHENITPEAKDGLSAAVWIKRKEKAEREQQVANDTGPNPETEKKTPSLP